MSYGLDGKGFGFRVPAGAKSFLLLPLSSSSTLILESSQPLSHGRKGDYSKGAKLLASETDHSPLTGDKVKNTT
jgi:hypothetical protein